MRNLLKRVLHPFLSRGYQLYRSKERSYSFRGLDLSIPPSVFHPGHLISTGLMADFVNTLQLSGAEVLDLGCGSGAIGLIAARSGATVISTDVNPEALAATKRNAKANSLEIEVIESDVFHNLKDRKFDFILVNPPYYPKEPQTDGDRAFFCGENFEYFNSFFAGLIHHQKETGKTYMILSEDVDLDVIHEISRSFGLELVEVDSRRKWFEWNYIFSVE